MFSARGGIPEASKAIYRKREPHPLVIVGAGGFGREVLWLVRDLNRAAGRTVLDPVGFVDDDPAKKGRLVNGVPVIGSSDEFRSIARQASRPFAAALGVGDPRLKMRIRDALDDDSTCGGLLWPSLVHPTAQIDESTSSVGQGCVVCRLLDLPRLATAKGYSQVTCTARQIVGFRLHRLAAILTLPDVIRWRISRR